MDQHRIVSHEQWLAARKQLLAREKDFTHQRDELSRQRRDLPWERVEKNYVFDGPNGKESLGDLFAGKSQLIVYHFMFAPEWEEGCKSCSFWADNFERLPIHLKHRDVSLVAISRAPFAKLDAYRKRLGWSFKWLSSGGNDFNYDYLVSFREANETDYNYTKVKVPTTDLPGVSVFYKDAKGDIFHTYSAYARGIDLMNAAYQYLDLTPKGRDEGNGTRRVAGLGDMDSMAWLRRNDEYKD